MRECVYARVGATSKTDTSSAPYSDHSMSSIRSKRPASNRCTKVPDIDSRSRLEGRTPFSIVSAVDHIASSTAGTIHNKESEAKSKETHPAALTESKVFARWGDSTAMRQSGIVISMTAFSCTCQPKRKVPKPHMYTERTNSENVGFTHRLCSGGSIERTDSPSVSAGLISGRTPYLVAQLASSHTREAVSYVDHMYVANATATSQPPQKKQAEEAVHLLVRHEPPRAPC